MGGYLRRRATVYQSPTGQSLAAGSIRLGTRVTLLIRVKGAPWPDPPDPKIGQQSEYWYKIRGPFEVYIENQRVLKPAAEGYINEVMIRKQ